MGTNPEPRTSVCSTAPKPGCPRRIRRGAKLEAMSPHIIKSFSRTAETAPLNCCVDTIAFTAHSAVTSMTPRPSFNVDSKSLFSNCERHVFAFVLHHPNDVLTAPSEPIPHPRRTASRARVVVHRSVMVAHSSFTLVARTCHSNF